MTYLECAFTRCKRPPIAELPLCSRHCEVVYLDVKDLLDNASLSARTQAANNGGRPRVLASKVKATIYFARVGDLIKIGYTTNLTERMSNLRAELLATMSGTMATEKALHAKFGPLWDHGEYFRPGQELLDYIASVRQHVT